MDRKKFCILCSLAGIGGVVILITSFIINAGPPPNASVAQLAEFSKQHYNSIVLGAWMQAISPPMIVLFALSIVHLAGAAQTFSGWMTFFGGVILVMVSMIEITFYFSAVNGNPATTGLISLELISAVQHLYSIIAAPMLFIAISIVILQSNVIPHFYGIAGFFFGAAFTILGILALFSPLQYLIDYLSMVQGFWWLTAALSMLLRADKIASQMEPITALDD